MDYVNGIDSAPEEGKIYVISNFSVDDAKYSYSAVSNRKDIFFLKFTTMTEVEEDEMIPKYKFELVAFNTLENKVGDTKILTDLMGLIQNRLPMQSRNTPTGPKDILMFDISDGSATVKVTVWADLANKLNEELDRMNAQDNIIILTSCGITKYRNQLQASTLSPSKYYINPDYDAVYNLRYRLNAKNEPIVLENTSSVDDCTLKKTPVYNLKQITELRNSELKEMEVICHVSVCSVEAQSKWWFYICDSCPRELSVIDDNYKCECGKIGSYPDKRFKVPIYVTDPSETIQVFLFDREVRRLTSTNVNGLIGQNIKEGKRDKYPEKLKAIEGKNLALTISLNEKNLVHGNTVYFATDVVEEVKTPSQTSEITSHDAHPIMVSESSQDDNAIDDNLECKPASNKRKHGSDNGPNKNNKSKMV